MLKCEKDTSTKINALRLAQGKLWFCRLLSTDRYLSVLNNLIIYPTHSVTHISPKDAQGFRGHPFYESVYEKAAKIDKGMADNMDTCIIK